MKKDYEFGFTLVEVIVSLLLIGIMASIAGFGLAEITNSYLFSKEVDALTQKSRYAMSRIRKSILNMQSGSFELIDSNTFKIKRNGNEEYFHYVASKGELYLSDDGADLDKYILADRVTGFNFQNNNDAIIEFDIQLKGDNVSKLVFRDAVYARNQVDPDMDMDILVKTAGTMGEFCLIRTAFDREGDALAVKLLREFRDRFLHGWPGGEKVIRFYYRNSPEWAGLISGNPGVGSVLRWMLLPVVGIVFLLLYHPMGLLALLFMLLIFSRLFPFSIKSGRNRFVHINGNSGSILIGLIITMMIMAVLGSAMVSMFSTNTMNTTMAGLTQRAYYLAESGYNYALGQSFRQPTDSDFIDSLNLGGNISLDGGQFSFQVETYWYDIETGGSTLAVTVPGGSDSGVTMPNSITNGDELPFVFTDSASGQQKIIDCTVSGKYSDSMNLTPDSSIDFTISSNNPVFPGAWVGSSQTLNAEQLGDESDTTLSLKGKLDALPPKNGVIFLKDSSFKLWILQYDSLDTDNSQLKGIHYVRGNGFPSGGISVDEDAMITFAQFAMIVVTGVVDPGHLNVSQTISYAQPLAKFPAKISGSASASEITSILGQHSADTQDGHEVIKIDQTQSTYSYLSAENVFQQESLATVDWNKKGMSNFLRDLWKQSDKKLSYDLQAKFKFTETEDDTYSDNNNSTDFYLNHPGCYMPGISFRTKKPEGGTDNDWTYYGLSIMRGIQGHSAPIEIESGSGCNVSSYKTEEDDISDNLYDNHGSNSDTASISTCPDSDFSPSTWNDEPPLDGIPYLVLWQKNVSKKPSGCSWDAYSPWEWLSYVPLLDYKEVTLRYYFPLEKNVEYEYRVEHHWWGWETDEFTLTSDNHKELFETVQEGVISNDLRHKGLKRTGGGSSGTGCEDKEYIQYWRDYKAYKLKDPYHLFGTTTVEGVEILGHYAPHYKPQAPGEPVRDPSTITSSNPKGSPVSKWTSSGSATPVAYIVKPLETYASSSDYPEFANTKEKYRNFAARANYRIYPKPWVTLMARVYEMEGNLDCNASTGTGDNHNGRERVNAISAFISSPENHGDSGNEIKDSIRKGVSLGTVVWPEEGDYYTQAVWGKGLTDEKKGFTSKVTPKPSWLLGCAGLMHDIKTVEIGRDADGDPVTTFTGTFTTKDYNFSKDDIPEFGLHTLGISSPNLNDTNGIIAIPAGVNVENHRETAYFTDFSWSVVGEKNALFPGMQSQ